MMEGWGWGCWIGGRMLFDTVSGMPSEKVAFQQRWEKGASCLLGEEGIALVGTKGIMV